LDRDLRPRLAAVVLDFDGLILDTETPLFEAWQEAYRLHGHELRLADWQHSLGTHGGFDPVAHLSWLAGAGFEAAAVERQVRERYRTRCDRQPLLPGVADLLAEARSLGLGTAVASSSTRGWVESWIEHHGIRPLFDTVCGRDDVAQVKPAPDLFLLAAERLAVPPARCVVFEDSPNGMRAARAAGMRCVAVPNPLTRELSLPDPDLVVSSAAELPLAEIAQRLGFRLTD
jgi:HAD superfamily hydrolase (TIGR01509 family)